jgi:hypothetical protein
MFPARRPPLCFTLASRQTGADRQAVDPALDGEDLIDAPDCRHRQRRLAEIGQLEKWRRPWLQHAASVIGPSLRFPS